MSPDPRPVVDTDVGPVRGRVADGVAAFLGVPYAASPVGARRFRPPEPRARSPRVRDATCSGPTAPQPSSRLQAAVGPMGITAQDEDCLTLDVRCPADGEDGAPPRPVLVWLHGGAFLAGSASQPWYDGTRLVREQGLVVVSVTHRLGVLGYLHLPGDDGVPANLGLHDQLAALRWVHRNIAAFGGDPGRVTVAGQSAGAQSILAVLHHRDVAGRLFDRAVLQSAPLGLPPLAVEEAERRARLVLDELSIRGAPARLRDVPVAGLLAAQDAVTRREARPLQLGPAFQLVADGDTVPADLLAPPVGAVALTVTANAHEADAFTVPDPRVRSMTTPDVRAALRPLLGDATDDRLARQGAGAPARLASDLLTAHYFHDDLDALVDRLGSGGTPVSTHRFAWHPSGSPLRAAHCIDLPFTFGTLEAWRESPLLRGADEDELADRMRSMRSLRRELYVGPA